MKGGATKAAAAAAIVYRARTFSALSLMMMTGSQATDNNYGRCKNKREKYKEQVH